MKFLRAEYQIDSNGKASITLIFSDYAPSNDPRESSVERTCRMELDEWAKMAHVVDCLVGGRMTPEHFKP